MAANSLVPVFDFSFPHHWQAEVLPARPIILPTRHFVYPREAEEVERGALEVLIRPTEEPGEESNPKRPPSAKEFRQRRVLLDG